MAEADAAKPKAYPIGRMEGGELPEIGKLLADTVADFTDNLGPYALAALGQYLVALPVAIGAVLGGYLLGGIAFAVVSIAGVVVGAGISENVNQGAGALVAVAGQLGATVLMVVILFALIAVAIGILAPVQASLVRAVAAQQRGEGTLELGSAFSTVTRDVGKVIAVNVIIVLLSLLGAMLCYVPALAVAVLFPLTTSLVALHGTAPVAALARSYRHATANFTWYLVFGLIIFAGGMFAAYVPVIGPAFLIALVVRASRHAFGDPA